jgi:hypothetical protein
MPPQEVRVGCVLRPFNLDTGVKQGCPLPTPLHLHRHVRSLIAQLPDAVEFERGTIKPRSLLHGFATTSSPPLYADDIVLMVPNIDPQRYRTT